MIDRELREAQNREGKRQTKEALRESELRYRLLWETATDAVILFDRDGTIEFANPAVEEVFGYKPAELIGKEVFLLQPVSQHWSKDGGLRSYLNSAAPDRVWRARESVGLKKEGAEFPVEIAFSNIQIDDKVSYVVFFRDIS